MILIAQAVHSSMGSNQSHSFFFFSFLGESDVAAHQHLTRWLKYVFIHFVQKDSAVFKTLNDLIRGSNQHSLFCFFFTEKDWFSVKNLNNLKET